MPSLALQRSQGNRRQMLQLISHMSLIGSRCICTMGKPQTLTVEEAIMVKTFGKWFPGQGTG